MASIPIVGKAFLIVLVCQPIALQILITFHLIKLLHIYDLDLYKYIIYFFFLDPKEI